MLFTRCPDCDTTFRVTDEVLKKANGQVRCGRCASVFNAYAELHDPAAKSFDTPASPATQGRDATAARERAPTAANASNAADEPSAAPHDTTVTDAAAESIAATSIAEVVAQVATAEESAARADANEPAGEVDLISPREVDQVLTAPGSGVAYGAPSWATLELQPQSRLRSRWWSVAAVLAIVTLAAQALHHFRADIASHSTFGPWLTRVYAALGEELTPTYDVRQYQILDWVATAEPNSRGLGSLRITARIQNRGPLRQPYPAVQLRLKDRWEAAVGSRLFKPAEYLPSDTPRGRLMSPGETARAQIEVVDPGPDAYGFELDVCIEVEASLVTCGSDAVFL